MAKEKKEPDFDAAEFIESVRQSSVPTYHTAADCAKTAPSGKPSEKPPEKKADNKPKAIPYGYDDSETDMTTRYAGLNMTDGEIDFIKTFIADGRFRRVTRHGRAVFIRERHLAMITDILGMLDEEANISTYIDRVLTEHFRKYYSIIQGISQKCPSKF